MHRPLLAILCLLSLAGDARADDGAEKDEKLPKVHTLEAVASLEPGLERVAVTYRKGMFARLVARCPGLRHLVIVEHSDLPPEDVRELAKLKSLESIEISGDLGIGEDVFEALGELETLKHAKLALG